MTDDRYEREIARLSGFDIRDDDHGGLSMGGAFEFEGAGQGLGYQIDIDFVQKLMAVFRVKRLQDVNGKVCWVTHSSSDVRLIEPVRKCEGAAFDVHEWSREAQARFAACKAIAGIQEGKAAE